MTPTAPKPSPKQILRFAIQLAETGADLDAHEATRHAAASALCAMLTYGDFIELALRKRHRCGQVGGTAA